MRPAIKTPERMVQETRAAAFRLLEQASVELERGNTANAERLAHDARTLQSHIRR